MRRYDIVRPSVVPNEKKWMQPEEEEEEDYTSQAVELPLLSLPRSLL
jgi:hypothetical protein